MSLKDKYLSRAANPVYAGYLLARDLMRGDDQTDKAGYDADAAAIAAARTLDLDAPGLAELCTALGADLEKVLSGLAHATSPAVTHNPVRELDKFAERLRPADIDMQIDPGEVASFYVAATDRYVVSMIVGYGEDTDVSNPAEAAAAVLETLTATEGLKWWVYDRQEKQMHCFDQRDFDPAQD